MCRTTGNEDASCPNRLLDITAFYLKLSLLSSPSPTSDHQHRKHLLPYSPALLYFPRSNCSHLEINGSNIRHDLPGYVTLHRFIAAGSGNGSYNGCVVFGTREKIRVGKGATFFVYLGGEKLLKGSFKRDISRKGWRVESTCVLEIELEGVKLAEAEVCVAADGGRMMMRSNLELKRRRRCWGFEGLDDIPEEEEREGSCGCCSESGLDGGEEDLTEVEAAEMESGMEGVRRVINLGIWTVSLGVGYLVSRASAKRLQSRNILFY